MELPTRTTNTFNTRNTNINTLQEKTKRKKSNVGSNVNREKQLKQRDFNLFKNELRTLIKNKNVYDNVPLLREIVEMNNKTATGIPSSQFELESDIIDRSVLFLKNICPKEESVLAFYSLVQLNNTKKENLLSNQTNIELLLEKSGINPIWTLDIDFWICLEKLYSIYSFYPSDIELNVLLYITTNALKQYDSNLLKSEKYVYELSKVIGDFIWETNSNRYSYLIMEFNKNNFSHTKSNNDRNKNSAYANQRKNIPLLPNIAKYFKSLFEIIHPTLNIKGDVLLSPYTYLPYVSSDYSLLPFKIPSYSQSSNYSKRAFEKLSVDTFNWNNLAYRLGIISPDIFKEWIWVLLLSFDQISESQPELLHLCPGEKSALLDFLLLKLENSSAKYGKINYTELKKINSPIVDYIRESNGEKRISPFNKETDGEIIEWLINWIIISSGTDLRYFIDHFQEISRFLESKYQRQFGNVIFDETATFILPMDEREDYPDIEDANREFDEEDDSMRKLFIDDNSNISNFPWMDFLYPTDTITGYMIQVAVIITILNETKNYKASNATLSCLVNKGTLYLEDFVTGSISFARNLESEDIMETIEIFLLQKLLSQSQNGKVPNDPKWLFYILSLLELHQVSLQNSSICFQNPSECLQRDFNSYLIYRLWKNKNPIGYSTPNFNDLYSIYKSLTLAQQYIEKNDIFNFNKVQKSIV